MKYCRECGNQLIDLAAICPKCGAAQPDVTLQTNTIQQQNEQVNKQASSKNSAAIQGKGFGFLLTFFAGLIGLIICLALGDDDCKKASLITFVVSIVLSIVLVILYIVIIAAAVSSSYPYGY